MTSNKFSTSSLPMSVSSCITSFLPFICVQDCPHFTAHHNVVKDNAENSDFLFLQLSCDDSFKTVPSTSSEPVDTRLPTQEGKHTSQESASTSKRPSNCHGGFRLGATESSAVICWAWTTDIKKLSTLTEGTLDQQLKLLWESRNQNTSSFFYAQSAMTVVSGWAKIKYENKL